MASQSEPEQATSRRPLGILVALEEERQAVRSILERPRSVRAGGGEFLAGEVKGHPVVLARTGIGITSARNAALSLVRTLEPATLIAAGFAGAADERLRTGDIVIGDPLHDPPRPEGEGPRDLPPHPDLVAAARSVRVPGLEVWTGTLVTARRVVSSSREKKELRQRHRALALDMESLGVARAANVHDTPHLCVRVVIDEASMDLPANLDRLVTPAGRRRYIGILRAVLSSPRSLAALGDLRSRSITARRALASYLAALIPAIAATPLTPPTSDV